MPANDPAHDDAPHEPVQEPVSSRASAEAEPAAQETQQAGQQDEDHKHVERIKRGTRDYVRYTQLGLQIAATVGLSAAAGYALDTWLKTAKPWFTLGLSLLGIAAAMMSIFRLVKDKD